MNIAKKTFWLFCAICLLSGFVSCKNSQKKASESQSSTFADSIEAGVNDTIPVTFLLPSPGEILFRFYVADFDYMPDLLNPAQNSDKYIGSKAQLLNLGVYITDMAYTAMNERSAETVKYLETIQSLSQEVGISSAVFESLITRSKANAGQLDSLFNISNEAFTNMLEFLESGGKDVSIAYMSAGAYIESLFLALQSIEAYSEDDKLIKLLIEMKYPMENLLGNARYATETESDTAMITYLNDISQIFDEMGKSGSETVITKTESGVISIRGGEERIMSETNFNNLKYKVTEIRKKIVGI
jgi:hypothetical protein